MTRPGHGYQSPPDAVVHRLDTLALPVSSSEIRRKLAAGMAILLAAIVGLGYSNGL